MVAENDNMGELGSRWILAGLAVCAAGWLGTPNFPFAATIAIAWASVSTLMLLRLDRENRGIAGFLAAVDALAIALLLSGAARLGTFGWLAALPVLHAITRYGARPAHVSSLASGMVLLAHVVVQQKLPSGLLCAQLAGILAIGFVSKPAAILEPTESVGPIDPLGASDPESLLGLRESFRQLKTLYRNLQWKSRRDHIVAALLEARLGDDGTVIQRLADQVRELTGATSARIFAVCQSPKGFGSAEGFLRINPDEAVGRIRHRADQLMATFGAPTVNIPLVSDLGVVGLCTLTVEQSLADDIRITAGEIAPILGGLLQDAELRQVRKQNDAIATLRLDCLARTRGSATKDEMASRAADVLYEAFSLHHLTIRIAGVDLAVKGGGAPPGDLLDSTEDIVAPDAANHPSLQTGDAARLRLGSMLSIRIGQVQIVATAREGVLNSTVADQWRAIAADLDWVQGCTRAEGGLVSAEAFRARMSEPGILVLFEFGDRHARSTTDVEKASTSLRSRALDFLPSRGALLVREDGDVLVHLPAAKLAEATNWGQRVAQAEAGIRVRTASLWPPTNAVIAIEETEPDALFVQSMN